MFTEFDGLTIFVWPVGLNITYVIEGLDGSSFKMCKGVLHISVLGSSPGNPYKGFSRKSVLGSSLGNPCKELKSHGNRYWEVPQESLVGN